MLNWYNTLMKPPLTPPAWVFPPVWIVLYVMMAVSLIFYIKDGLTKRKTRGLVFFCLQLVLNLLWSPIFFVYRNISLAFVVVILMIVFTVATIVVFRRESKIAAYLLVPYLLWISFAAYLNFGFLLLN